MAPGKEKRQQQPEPLLPFMFLVGAAGFETAQRPIFLAPCHVSGH